MSLLGKILMVINIFAALAFFYLVAADFGQHQSWSYAVMRQDFILDGLPLDEGVKEGDGTKIVDKISDKTLKEMFQGVGGPPDGKTQEAEVFRVKQNVQSEIDGVAAEAQKREKLLSVLIPLKKTGLERDKLKTIETVKLLADLETEFNTALQKTDDLEKKTNGYCPSIVEPGQLQAGCKGLSTCHRRGRSQNVFRRGRSPGQCLANHGRTNYSDLGGGGGGIRKATRKNRRGFALASARHQPANRQVERIKDLGGPT